MEIFKPNHIVMCAKDKNKIYDMSIKVLVQQNNVQTELENTVLIARDIKNKPMGVVITSNIPTDVIAQIEKILDFNYKH